MHTPLSFSALLLSAAALSAIAPTNSVWATCLGRPDVCGDVGCARAFCSSEGLWECSYSPQDYSCASGAGHCDNGMCMPGAPITRSLYNGTSCGCINAQWSAPRGSLILIDSGSGAVKTLVGNLGEIFTHEMIAQDYGYASQSEYAGPTQTSDCNYPLNANSLQFGFPGMEKDIGAGAIYADIYGGGAITFNRNGSSTVIWQQGDVNRANAIADALNAKPYISVQVHGDPGYLHRILWNGSPSPYGLYQYFNIESTNLGDSGQSTNNTSVSSTFCAYAYALGGAPMAGYNYGHQETVNAANAFWNYTYNQCYNGLPWYVKDVPFASLLNPSCSPSIICNNAAAMILNCTAVGGANCGNNNNFPWQTTLTPASSHANSISPDRLGGLTRFINELPRPTTWAADVTHQLVWNSAGMTCGCFD